VSPYHRRHEEPEAEVKLSKCNAVSPGNYGNVSDVVRFRTLINTRGDCLERLAKNADTESAEEFHSEVDEVRGEHASYRCAEPEVLKARIGCAHDTTIVGDPENEEQDWHDEHSC